MPVFTWKPAPGASLALKPTVESAKYGDGYEQRTGWGINTQLDKWSIKIPEDAIAAHAFLKARGGHESFNWTNPLGVTGVYICREWKLNHIGVALFDLTCDFEEVADNGDTSSSSPGEYDLGSVDVTNIEVTDLGAML